MKKCTCPNKECEIHGTLVPDQHSESEPKPLAQYLAEYLATGIDRVHEAGLPMDYAEEGLKPIFEQALDAYESTEQVKIEIKKL